MNKLLILDNHDSFTYNLVQLVEQHGGWDFDVLKNNEIGLCDVSRYQKILLSPGPGLPAEAGIMKALIKEYASTKSIFGVCLGLQAIVEVFGGRLYNFEKPVHGEARKAKIIAADPIFKNLPNTISVGLYHSWAVEKSNFPEDLQITALSEKGVIMAVQHRAYDIHGVQFHPESIITAYGQNIIENWLDKAVSSSQ